VGKQIAIQRTDRRVGGVAIQKAVSSPNRRMSEVGQWWRLHPKARYLVLSGSVPRRWIPSERRSVAFTAGFMLQRCVGQSGCRSLCSGGAVPRTRFSALMRLTQSHVL
jgi:hypothetical protein